MSDPTSARAGFARWQSRMAQNAVDADPHLASLLRLHGHAALLDTLRPFGAEVAGRLDTLARETNKDAHLPQLRRYTPDGRRIEQIVFHPGYHEMGRIAYGTGLFGRYRTPGHELETLAIAYLYAQNGEAGHGCPFACTAGLIKILQDAPGAPAEWLERLYDPDYDTHIHAAQWLTEVQGGSDVGANALVARETPDGWRLYGEKWFCSVIDAQLALVTARPEGNGEGTGGLAAFVVPRARDGAPNGFAIRRLKDKLGTRSMASAEVDFDGAWAYRVADFKKVVEVVLNTSRLYNAVNAAGFLHRAWREADAYARERLAFGQPILRFPIIARVVATLFVEACAARASTFLLAAMADRIACGDIGEAPAWRMLVNLNKIWTATTCPAGIRSAIEVFGGNGAIEEFGVLPRLLRDSIVLEAWEGGHGVLCAQILRDAQRLRLHVPMFALLRRLDPAQDWAAVEGRWDRVLAGPDGATHIRTLVEELRPMAQAAALAAETGDARLAAVRADLLAVHARGYDPLDDATLATRVATILGG